ncbi:hypothetical protein L2E82_40725 [Cichorium intybus]|uniref:Uncharacterized protein n=1 Tax=Cichorium intybus TaxID=13427 RepID=A0ACB9ALL3_CICIN|nr:hypothetical protein L2E82_40725 [Cichorium intybus]
MKPRQLSDAIHQEVGGKVNEQISNGLWEIIRSPDDIKTEITETVHEKDTVGPSSPPGFPCGVERKDEGDNGSDEDSDAPPGFG